MKYIKVIVAAIIVFPSVVFAANATQSIAGTYGCMSFNSGGLGGFCTSTPPIILNTNGTYSMSSEKGTYTVKGATISLSKSKVRGVGAIIDGNKIRFSYPYKNVKQTITYLRSAAPSSIKKSSVATPSVPVGITLIYSKRDGSLGYINEIILVPHGSSPDAPPGTNYSMLAYFGSNKMTIVGAYHARDGVGVPTGIVYDVYTNTGFQKLKVGTVDLTNSAGPVNATLHVTINNWST